LHRKKAGELMGLSSRCKTPAEFVAANRENAVFSADQHTSEISRLLEIIAELRPRHACEIGSYNGGTLFLVSQMCTPDAKIVSIDIDNNGIKRRIYPRLAGEKRSIFCINGDSHLDSTRARLEAILGRKPLDFLFIDGDHSYEGVRRDFELYGPLVRSGGVIGFHDIVPDHRMRYGVETRNWVGEVPRFWNELKEKFDSWDEIIPDQVASSWGGLRDRRSCAGGGGASGIPAEEDARSSMRVTASVLIPTYN
jgi:predicted O-methyltransferase YrrM